MTNALHARGTAPDGPRDQAAGPVLVGCSHGTDDADGRAAVRSILTGISAYRPDLDVREAFVDVQEPEVADVVSSALDGDASGAVVVPRDQVLAALPGDSQDPHAAEVAIARLRDATGSRQLIRTVVKRGYRLQLEEV